ncbi:MAG: TRAP transporter TatT component family protein [Bacteriovoracia bacterium]
MQMKSRRYIIAGLLLLAPAWIATAKEKPRKKPAVKPSPVVSASPAPSPTPTPPASPYALGDQLFYGRADGTKAQEALKVFRELWQKNPQDFEAGWRVSMACYFVGIRLTPEGEPREKLYAEGRDIGKESIKLAKEKKLPCAACNFWTAINMALYGESVGVFKMLFTLNEIQTLLKASIEADPSFAYAGAYRLLGMIEWKLPGILGGSNSRAKDYFEKAIAQGPTEPLNYLFLARLLDDKFDERAEALNWAKKGLEVPVPTPDRLEALDALKDLQEFIQTHPAPTPEKPPEKAD